jgi:hypothetical protein
MIDREEDDRFETVSGRFWPTSASSHRRASAHSKYPGQDTCPHGLRPEHAVMGTLFDPVSEILFPPITAVLASETWVAWAICRP